MRFESCGWEAKDLAEYLTVQGQVQGSAHIVSTQMDSMEADGFGLVIEIAQGGDPNAVLEYLRGAKEKFAQTDPMFKSIAAMDTIRTDMSIDIKCGAIETPEEAIAEELLRTLTSEVDFRNPSHPVHGTIMDAKRHGSRVVINSGEGKANDAAKFMQDFVDRGRKTKHPEFAGVYSVEPDHAQNHIDILIKPSKMSKAKVASEVAAMVEREFDLNEKSAFHNLLLSIKETRSGVTFKVMGPEGKFSELASRLKEFFEKETKGDNIPAKGVKKVQVKIGRGKGVAVAVRFTKIGIPPLFEVAPGHTAACYLYGPPTA